MDILHKDINFYFFFVLYFTVLNVIRIFVFQGTVVNTYFQADYVLPPMVACVCVAIKIHRHIILSLVYVTGLLASASDVIVSVGKMFRWGPDAVPQYITGYHDLPWGIISGISAILMISWLPLSVMLTWAARNRFALWPLDIFVLGLLAADDIFGETRFNEGSKNINILSTSLQATLPVYLNSRFREGDLKKTDSQNMQEFYKENFDDKKQQILSISLESFGLSKYKYLNTYMVDILYKRLAGLYIIESYSHSFQGGTIHGEIRELCGLMLTGAAGSPKVIPELGRCLPKYLARKGYKTFAFHGNGSSFYERRSVYPAMGFQENWFYQQFRENYPNNKPCTKTLFHGICDKTVYNKAMSLFDGKNKFIHVMTLDSHLPLPRDSHANCPNQIKNNEIICDYVGYIRNSIEELVKQIELSRTKPDVVFIYGDHSPPFNLTRDRRFFFSSRVPFYVLHKK